MTTVTGTPADRPAHAYACPAFPADSVMTPFAFATSGNVAILLVIPRGLNEPVFWRFSALRYRRSSRILTPVAARVQAAAVSELISGVRWTRPAMRLRAATISSIVTRWLGVSD